MNKVTISKLHWGGVFTILVLLPLTLHAQPSNNQSNQGKEFIRERVESRANIPSNAQNRIQKLSNVSTHKSIHPVRLPERLYEEDKLTIYINPNSNRIQFSKNNGAEEIQIIRTEIDVVSDDQYIWIGDVYNQSYEFPIGSATFVQDSEGEINGNIDIQGLMLQIHPLAQSGLHAIVEFDELEMDRHDAARAGNRSPDRYGAGSNSGNSSPFLQGSTINENYQNQFISDDLLFEEEVLTGSEFSPTCAMRYIRAMVLYTPDAASYGNINNIIALAINETNQAYTNSGITNVNVVLQHSQEFDFIEGEDILDARTRLIADSAIIALRNFHDADVVMMLTEAGTYKIPNDGGSCNEIQCPPDPSAPDNNTDDWGIAGTLFLESEKAYAIVDVSRATGPSYTFAHELGHLQAARHHPDDEPNNANPLYDYAHGHRFSFYHAGFIFNRSTIMAWTIPGVTDTHIKYFSTPYKSYFGVPLGIADVRDNSRGLNTTRVTVSNFRDGNEPSAGINYSVGTTNQYGQNHTFINNSCGGSGSISYQWRKSLGSPNNFGGVQSTSSSWFVNLSPGTWYIKLTVNTSTGQTNSKVISVVVDENGGQPCFPGLLCEDPGGPQLKLSDPEAEKGDERPDAFTLLPAYPNPFNPTTQISFELPESRHVKVVVYDMAGRELTKITDQFYNAGKYQVRFDGSAYSSGNYIIRFQAGEFVTSQTISLIK